MNSLQHNLPPQPTPFVGREEELAAIQELLADPHCRLLTLAGPGGIGKTRLALECASKQTKSCADGVFFVDLQPIKSYDFVVSAIADVVRCPTQGIAAPEKHLLGFLRDKRMLLVLDNFEHLLDNVGLLTALLDAAPWVKLIVTSREVLNVQEEWVYALHGMSYPPGAHSADTAVYSAVNLFLERARRVRHTFSLTDEQAGVTRICQLVEGMPLAIELAASWVKSVRCATIAAEIQRRIDFLTSGVRNVPERHRSMQAVFDQSLASITSQERAAFMRLSVFRGSFRRETAEAVAGADLQILMALGDKSLLQYSPDGRYHIHELLRQYMEEKLSSEPGEALRVHDAHCSYFTSFLAARYPVVHGGRQREAIAEIELDLDNIRSAWQWALERADTAALCAGGLTFYYYCQFRSRFREGVDALEKAVLVLEAATALDHEQRCLAEFLVALGWLHIRLGDLDKAAASLEGSQRISANGGVRPRPGMGSDPRTALGILRIIQGNYNEAAALGEEARRDSEAHDDPFNLMFSYYVLTSAYRSMGNYQEARRNALQAVAIAKQLNNSWFMAYCLNELGHAVTALGDYVEAHAHFVASYDIKKEFDDPEGMAVALSHLGDVALLQGDYAGARHAYEQSISRYRDIGDLGGLAQALYGLGRTTCGLNDYAAARHFLKGALETATEAHILPLTLSILGAIGDLLTRSGQVDRGLRVLALVLAHPAAAQETRESAEHILENLLFKAGLQPAESMSYPMDQTLQIEDFDVIVSALQSELGAEERHWEGTPDEPAGGKPRASTIDRISKLTGREYEVLRCVAEGLPNREIAERLVLTEGTVKWYVSQLTSKLGAENRTQAVVRARELGLLS